MDFEKVFGLAWTMLGPMKNFLGVMLFFVLVVAFLDPFLKEKKRAKEKAEAEKNKEVEYKPERKEPAHLRSGYEYREPPRPRHEPPHPHYEHYKYHEPQYSRPNYEQQCSQPRDNSTSRKKPPQMYSYKKRGWLFSQSEISFLHVLEMALPNEYRVFGKVRMSDVLDPDESRERKLYAFRRITSKHFDYVICKKSDLSIVLAIELDGMSHNSPERIDRDIFVDTICARARLPLLRIEVQNDYQVEYVRQKLGEYLPVSIAEIKPVMQKPKPVPVKQYHPLAPNIEIKELVIVPDKTV